ncbi:hypothetical protein DYI23_05890 [Roseibium polysiphoniae]|uniref:Uncharacterized protein n=1 Tax=Roseibium polysiphoniae TaxID=2571221 RepID=A0A944CC20_9HYPH|nr:hypothetical protein [Roseibium polysiphoniae]MBS8259745.1 hypothetical protein [Roseibium polysiphoniae]
MNRDYRYFGAITVMTCMGTLVGFLTAALLSDGTSTLREWLASLSGWAAAVVGGVTIFAIYQQIKRTSEDTHRTASDAREIFIQKMRSVLRDMNMAWKEAEDLQNYSSAEVAWSENFTKLKKHIERIRIRAKKEDFLRELSSMHLLDEAKCQRLISDLESHLSPKFEYYYYENTEEIEKQIPEKDTYVQHCIMSFSRIYNSARIVDARLADPFLNRNVADMPDWEEVELNVLEITYAGFNSLDKNKKNPY